MSERAAGRIFTPSTSLTKIKAEMNTRFIHGTQLF